MSQVMGGSSGEYEWLENTAAIWESKVECGRSGGLGWGVGWGLYIRGLWRSGASGSGPSEVDIKIWRERVVDEVLGGKPERRKLTKGFNCFRIRGNVVKTQLSWTATHYSKVDDRDRI